MFKTLESLNKSIFSQDLCEKDLKKCKCCFLPEDLVIENDLYLASNSIVNVSKVSIDNK
jgi:hypothetical protein